MQVETGMKGVKMNGKETYLCITENRAKEGKKIGSQQNRK